MKKLFCILTLLVTLCLGVSFLGSALAAPSNYSAVKRVNIQSTSCIVDNYRILKEADRTRLLGKMQALEKQYNARIMIYTAPKTINYQARDYARSVVDYTVTNQKAVIFVLFMSNIKGQSNYYLAANKQMADYAITQGYGVDYVNNAVLPYLKGGNYTGALETYVQKTEELLSFAKKNGHPHTANDDFNMEAAVAAAFLGLLAGYKVRRSLIAAMSNVRPALEAGQYLLRDTFQLEDSSDTYLYTDTTVVPKSKHSHGGGGGGDGGCGGSGGGGSF